MSPFCRLILGPIQSKSRPVWRSITQAQCKVDFLLFGALCESILKPNLHKAKTRKTGRMVRPRSFVGRRSKLISTAQRLFLLHVACMTCAYKLLLSPTRELCKAFLLHMIISCIAFSFLPMHVPATSPDYLWRTDQLLPARPTCCSSQASQQPPLEQSSRWARNQATARFN